MILLARCLCLAVLLANVVNVGEPVGPLVLTDQYEHAWQLSDLRGSVVLLIDGDREGSKFNGTWGRAARARYKTEIKIAFVAHLASVPFFMHGFVRSKFVSKDPAHPNGPILLDWKGAVAQRFGFRDSISNVYVIDREGVLRYAGAGQALDAETDRLFRVLDGLLAR
jgi:predicted transcriptional regulator